MANAHLGEYKVTLGGKELTLKYSLDALAELEDHFKKPINAVVQDLQNPDVPNLRMLQKILHVGVSEFHPELTFQEIGKLSMPANAMKAISKAMFGGENDTPAAEGATQNPQ